MLSRMAALMAAEIRQHDWSDAPFRADRAGHDRAADSNRGSEILSVRETENVKLNVMWVTAQVLGHADPSFDVMEYAKACGIVNIKGGGWIKAGVRTTNGRYDPPGTFLWANQPLATCHVCVAYIEPDQHGDIRRESIVADGGDVVWGPVWVHEECRKVLSTPYDGREGFSMIWERVQVPQQ